jgi:hypothetical protein
MSKPKSRRSAKTTNASSGTVVLRSESKVEFTKLLEELNQEIQPEGFIERMYVEEYANLIWETLRARRVKTGIINNAWQTALERVLDKILLPPALYVPVRGRLAPGQFAHGWFVDEETRQCVSSLLEEAGLDWSAVETEAYRLRLSDLERLDRILAELEVRRDRCLRSIAKDKEGLARKIRQNSERTLSEDAVSSIATVDAGIDRGY